MPGHNILVTHMKAEPQNISEKHLLLNHQCFSFVQSKINSLDPRDPLALHLPVAHGQHTVAQCRNIPGEIPSNVLQGRKQGYLESSPPSKPNFVSFSLRCLNCISSAIKACAAAAAECQAGKPCLPRCWWPWWHCPSAPGDRGTRAAPRLGAEKPQNAVLGQHCPAREHHLMPRDSTLSPFPPLQQGNCPGAAGELSGRAQTNQQRQSLTWALPTWHRAPFPLQTSSSSARGIFARSGRKGSITSSVLVELLARGCCSSLPSTPWCCQTPGGQLLGVLQDVYSCWEGCRDVCLPAGHGWSSGFYKLPGESSCCQLLLLPPS